MATENEIKAAAIMGFVDLMIGAFESGFVNKNNPTLAEIHQVARNHIADSYGVNYSDIVIRHGEQTAKDCGFGEHS